MSQKKGQLKRHRPASFDNDDDHEDENKFQTWLNDINKILIEKLGLEITDLPDEDYRILFDEGISSNKVAKNMIYEYFSL